jgi:hypothetical protein
MKVDSTKVELACYTRPIHKLLYGSLEGELVPVPNRHRLFRHTERVTQEIYWDGWAYAELHRTRNVLDLSARYDRTSEDAMAMALQNPDFPPIADQLRDAYSMSKGMQFLAKNGQWREVFQVADKRVGWLIFRREYKNIPDELKYDAFMDFYVRAEDGFELVSTLYRHVFGYAHHSADRSARLLKLADDYTWTIYHGEQQPSIKDWYSWTLDKACAAWFAGRWGRAGEIWRKEVPRTAIVDFIVDKDENEILIDFAADPEYEVCEIVNYDPADPFQEYVPPAGVPMYEPIGGLHGEKTKG